MKTKTADKQRTLRFPFRKSYPWRAEVWVEMPQQFGRERRIFQVTGAKTFEFRSIKDDPNRATLKLTDLHLTLPATTIMLAHPAYPDAFWKNPIHIPELVIDSNAVDLKGSQGFVELNTGRFSLQFRIHLTPKTLPFLRAFAKKYQIDEVPVLVQEAGKLDLGKGNSYRSWIRFLVDPEYEGKFRFSCGGGKGPPACDTNTNIYASLMPDEKTGEKTVYICPGDEVYLFWHSSADVTEAKISPDVGTVNKDGFTQVRPTDTTTYKIEVKGNCKDSAEVRIRVIHDGDTMDMSASPVVSTDYWEYIMTENCVSKSIKVTSIEPLCVHGCTYVPAFNLIHLSCYNDTVHCHGIWAYLKEDPDGHLHTGDVSLIRVNLDDYPLAGIWRFWAYGFSPGYDDSYKLGGTANFRLWLKCGDSVMVNEAKGGLFRRKDGKYLLYIPKDLAEDSMFPIKATTANPKVRVKISFKVGDNKLTIEKWKENNEA